VSDREIVIAHASTGAWSPDCLRLQDRDLRPLREGELLLRSIYLSLDPSNLVWTQLDQTYIVELHAGDPMPGMVLAEVEESRAEGFVRSDMVLALADWATRSIVAARPGHAVPPVRIERFPGMPLAVALTVFSHIGLAAMIGMREVARIEPGDNVLVSSAAGAVGGLAAQIATARGCRVVGIAGGPEKRRVLLEELALDGAIDYRGEALGEALAREFPDGIDVYFDNVGGSTLDTVLLHLRDGARVAVCGQMSQYFPPPDGRQGVTNLYQLVVRNVRMEGFVPPRYAHRFEWIFGELGRLLAAGEITHRAHVVEGLAAVPEALLLLLSGGNRGKLLAQLAPDPWARG
jgi:NADPH-dependent curcumin reductase